MTNATQAPLISVCMTMYNVEPYIRECMDSILAQTFQDFELIVVNDGSTDRSADIVRSYRDSRIRLVENEHDYVGSLNLSLRLARGKYIARMDADDRLLPNRLEVQYRYMEAHPEIDILGAAMRCFGEKEYECPPYCVGRFGYLELLDCCGFYHPTTLARRERMEQVGLTYNPEYVYAEDYGLWCDAVQRGLHLCNLPDVLYEYRLCPTQVSKTKRQEQARHTFVIKERLMRAWQKQLDDYLLRDEAIRDTDKQLTVIIPFYNEGEFLRRTVENVRATAGHAVEIIAIDDRSDDGVDYQQMLAGQDVIYLRNAYRFGPAASKEKGVRCCRTPHFILLDAHVYFYRNDWADLLADELRRNPSQLLCCQTKALKWEDGRVVEKEADPTYGALIYWGMKKFTPMSMWNPDPTVRALRSGHIPCILGACYASSRTYWMRLEGYAGLLGYGCEEPYISAKAWMEGGRCRFMPDIVVGHIYKDYSAHSQMRVTYVYNFLFIADVLLPARQRCKVYAVIRSIDADRYRWALFLLELSADRRRALRERLQSRLQACGFDAVRTLNYVLPKGGAADLDKKCDLLPDLLHYCRAHCAAPQAYGLYEGRAGLMLLELLYARYVRQPEARRAALRLLQELNAVADRLDELPLTFGKGLPGIGWALLYAADHGLLQPAEAEGLLGRIDRRVACLAPARMPDATLAKGYTGLVAYVTARLDVGRRHGLTHHLPAGLISDMAATSRHYVQQDIAPDAYAHGQHLLMAEYAEADNGWRTARMDFSDIMELPTYLPRRQEHWSLSMVSGCLGYAIHLLITQHQYYENQ